MGSRPRVVVVGAGLAGAGIAWHLAGAADVVVVEQGPLWCAEASGQNAGMIRCLVRDPGERALAVRSHRRLLALDPTDWPESPVRRSGAVIATVDGDDTELAAAARALAAAGHDVVEPSPAELVRAAPALAGAALRRAWLLPGALVCDAHTLGAGLVAGARRRGAAFRFDTRVTALLRAGDRIEGVATERGDVRADMTVIAAGAWCRALARGAAIDRDLTPLARHLLFGRHPLATAGHPWCWLDDVGLYVRPDVGGFLCSPCDETEHEPRPEPGSRRAVDPLQRAVAADKLARFLPALRDLRLDRGWIGLRTFGAGRRPLIGPDPELAGLHWLAGLGGAGVTCALALGEIGAALLLGRPLPPLVTAT